jgi:hypothetical protein
MEAWGQAPRPEEVKMQFTEEFQSEINRIADQVIAMIRETNQAVKDEICSRVNKDMNELAFANKMVPQLVNVMVQKAKVQKLANA